MSLSSLTIGFIGAGNMAQAIASGMLKNSLITADRLVVSAPSEANMAQWRQWGAAVTVDNADVINRCDVVFLCVKPHLLETALNCRAGVDSRRIERLTDGRVLFVSVLAGINLQRLQSIVCQCLAVDRVCVIRSVPSTPCRLAVGCCCYCLPKAGDPQAAASDHQLQQHAALVELVFGALGSCARVDERVMDTCCAAFSSGVAFVLTFIDALVASAVRGGVSVNVARRMAAQTVAGAGQMALQSGSHPCQLRDEVSSPGGTTIAGLEALEEEGLRRAVMRAVSAATRRGEELSRQ